MNRSSQGFLFDLPGHYRIRVQGYLSASYSGRLSDMEIITKQSRSHRSVTTLTGDVKDQTALMGVLIALFDMGFPLLTVERLATTASGEGREG
ncbi:MAG: hypothetical protein U0822_04745 [Anaerolineae bacterium]